MIDHDLLAMMTQTIVVENIVATPTAPGQNVPAVLDGYGRHYIDPEGDGTSDSLVEYGNSHTYKCRLEYNTKVLATIDGRDRVSSGRAYLAGYFPNITTEARVTVPGATQPALLHPILMYIENNYDESGLVGYNTVLHFE